MLLVTKLSVPLCVTGRPQQPSLIPRPHLINRLRAGLPARLTLVSAPPGFGKTTLMAEWIRCSPFPDGDARFCWLALDESDNDPVRFFSYLIAALQTGIPTLGAAALALLHPFPPPTLEAVLTLVINELMHAPHALVLVLDDYHVITTPAIHAAVTFLVDHLPPTLHLVITSRADPLLPLARWRARRELAELHAADLRFTAQEVGLFMNSIMGLNLTAADLAILEARTEGWSAGLHLAALSLQGRNDASDFVASFAGSDRYIMDYMVDEVLEQLSLDTRQFLLQTALLDRLCSSLCDAVTGHTNGQRLLERLERANLFIVPLDNERRWYRYHHLFADVLRSRVQQMHPEQFPQSYRRASVWYEEHGFWVEVEAEVVTLLYTSLAQLRQAQGSPDDAHEALIAFLDLARQRGFAPHLISRAEAVQAQLRLAQGDLAAAQRWASSREIHPHHDLDSRELPYWQETERLVLARVLIADGRPMAADRLLARLLVVAETANRGHSVIEILVLRALLLQSQHNLPGALIVLQRALAMAEPERYVRTFLDEGAPMLVLLRHAQSQSLYADRLLTAALAVEIPGAVTQALLEPLSAREREVLHLIAQGASNQTIADTLVVAVATVKKHVSTILSKLNVASRAQAVVQARQLGIL
jgi:ATP/maltotriose-dependent transcriptional regulator MalT